MHSLSLTLSTMHMAPTRAAQTAPSVHHEPAGTRTNSTDNHPSSWTWRCLKLESVEGSVWDTVAWTKPASVSANSEGNELKPGAAG